MCLILQVGQLRKRGVNNSHAGLKLFPADILPISSCCTDMESKSKLCWLHRFQSERQHGWKQICNWASTALQHPKKKTTCRWRASLSLFASQGAPRSLARRAREPRKARLPDGAWRWEVALRLQCARGRNPVSITLICCKDSAPQCPLPLFFVGIPHPSVHYLYFFVGIPHPSVHYPYFL